MSTANVLEAVNAGIAILNLLSSLKVDISDLVELQNRARSEGREITEAELLALANRAQNAIDEL